MKILSSLANNSGVGKAMFMAEPLMKSRSLKISKNLLTTIQSRSKFNILKTTDLISLYTQNTSTICNEIHTESTACTDVPMDPKRKRNKCLSEEQKPKALLALLH